MFTKPLIGAIALAVATLATAAPRSGVAQQTVIVERNAKLRRDPSSAQQEIRTLAPGQELELLDTAKTNRYYHVVLAESHDTGWVWAATVRLDTGQLPDTAAASTVAASIDPAWTHPAPISASFVSPVSNRSCGPVGSPGDSATNRRKNRTDVPRSYHTVAFSAIADLPYPASKPKDRTQWPPESLAAIQRVEGAAVSVVGYLVAIRPQTGNSESTNCLMTQGVETDWHVALVQRQGDGEATSIVVETTPRIRARHPRWTLARLTHWVDSADPVRISGWLLFDPSHRNHLGRYRSTLWEVHPITRIEVWTSGRWADLDSLP